MKKENAKYFWRISNIVIIVTLHICLFSIGEALAQSESIKNSNIVQSFGEWKFSGHVGKYMDKISEARILNEENWNTIYPETEESFRLREDDKNYPNSGQWRGEFWGKYILSAIAAYHYYQDEGLKERIADATRGLLSTQDDNGYIGTYAHSDFLEGNNWNVWSRKYTLWGLVEAWELLHDDSILVAAKRFTDHLISEVGPGAVDIVRTGNFYGMPSSSILQPMVKLYRATGEEKYLDYSEYIVEQWSKYPEGLPDILNKGLKGDPVHTWFPETDPYKWAKAYEFMSCVEGLLELYEVTGEEQYLEAGQNIHAALVKWERIPIGNISFNDKHTCSAGLINTMSEICDAVYWNRLSTKLFEITGDVKYIEEIERTLYNSLLSAYNQEGTWCLRRMRMSHIHNPADNHFLQNHHCCTDNLPRGLFQAAEIVLTERDNKVYLSLFNEGQGNVILSSGQKAHFKIVGDFLEKGSTKINLSLDKPEKFSFLIRLPQWSKHTIIKINGVKQPENTPGKWMVIERNWKNNDSVEVSFNLYVRWELFDTTKFVESYHKINYYNNLWAEFKFVEGSNEAINRKYQHVKSLSPDDALPHKTAVTFFYGPIALARDIRITDGDIFAPIEFSKKDNLIKIQPIQAPPDIWKVFELKLGKGQKIKFCDFPSAGNLWNNNSKFNTWCILK